MPCICYINRQWNSPNHDTEEGFALFKVDGDKFNWEYVDYGWEVKK
ncbi:hypothetical protein ACE01N_07035 [Saccharicrinis sp. FJH2]